MLGLRQFKLNNNFSEGKWSAENKSGGCDSVKAGMFGMLALSVGKNRSF